MWIYTAKQERRENKKDRKTELDKMIPESVHDNSSQEIIINLHRQSVFACDGIAWIRAWRFFYFKIILYCGKSWYPQKRWSLWKKAELIHIVNREQRIKLFLNFKKTEREPWQIKIKFRPGKIFEIRNPCNSVIAFKFWNIVWKRVEILSESPSYTPRYLKRIAVNVTARTSAQGSAL